MMLPELLHKRGKHMNWQRLIRENVTTAEELRETLRMSQDEYGKIKDEIALFPMSVTRYYLSLINPDDPDDPIRKMSVPSGRTVLLDGDLDTSGEKSNTKIRGLQHKYRQTVLVLTTAQCAMYCRHCFRRRLVGMDTEETIEDTDKVIQYLKAHPEVNNVLLSGGDSFLLTTDKIEKWLQELSDLDQLSFIRFGTRTPVTFPQRILEDPQLCSVLKSYSGKKQIYVITHFNHPRELTDQSKAAIRKLQEAGAVVKNQTVLLKDINDQGEILGDLLNKLTSVGIIPHYVFQCRPVKGVKSAFQVPLGEGLDIVLKAKAMQNGLGKAVDYTMSHVTGKIRILGRQPDQSLLFQYVQAKDPSMIGRIFSGQMGDQTWLPDGFKL